MILHIDGDAFFASCEVAINPALRGKPVIIGRERGIATAFTYEAKARGVSRGMLMHQIRQLCPDAVILPGNFRLYGILSHRMFAIVRRYSDKVEEYSIDECFADFAGIDKALGRPFPEILKSLQDDLYRELGVTFSLGLADTKVLAKIASKWKKPRGITIILPEEREEFLKKFPIEKVWGIGRRTSPILLGRGMKTAYDFASQTEEYMKKNFAEPQTELWHELRGKRLFRVHAEGRDAQKSIQKTRSFPPGTTDSGFLFAELSRNIERACHRARRHRLAAREISIFLKTKDFRYHTADAKLPYSTTLPLEILSAAKNLFRKIYQPGTTYRASGITLRNLIPSDVLQLDFFGSAERGEKNKGLFRSIDRLEAKFGRRTVHLASSMEGKNPYRPRESEEEGNPIGRMAVPIIGEVC